MRSSEPARLAWVFDFISPFAYLSLKQLEKLPNTVVVEHIPVLFAGLLNHHGQIGNAEIPSKRRFTYRFAVWRARKLGVAVRMPPTHPFNPLSALRLAIAAGASRKVVETIFDAVFRDGRDVSDPNVLMDLAGTIGVADWQTAISAPAVKQKLHDNTAWAIAQGVFGVPTFVVGREIFWGQDAFEMVLDYLRDPGEFEDAEMRRIETMPVGVVRPRSARPAETPHA